MNLSSPFFVVSSDMLVNFNLGQLAVAHQNNKGIGTLSCYFRPKDQLKKSGVILFDKRTYEIEEFVERPTKPEEIVSQWVNSSVYLFSPKILPFIEREALASDVIDLPRDIFPKILSSGEKLFAHPFAAEKYYQLGIDTPDRIERAETDIDSGLFVPTVRAIRS